MRVEQTAPVAITDLWAGVESGIAQASHLEHAAQELATAVHSQFEESVTLARLFITVDFGSLPASNQAFVRDLAASAGAGSDVTDSTPVLSLVGTHGQETDWNDRRNSKGHVGIPLLSASFVGAIPMISRLLNELGLSLDWVDTRDSGMVQKTIGQSAGLFFVEHAGEAMDGEGRKIIPSQDFVSEHGIKSVFGVGGAYPDDAIVAMVAFCRDQFSRAAAEHFLPLVSLFKSRTAGLVAAGRIFAD